MDKIKIKEEQFRKNTDDYFKLSGIREYKKLNHTPFIVLNNDTIELCFNAKDLIENYLPETKVLGQWEGRWRSDFFSFRISDLIAFTKKHLKENYHIV